MFQMFRRLSINFERRQGQSELREHRSMQARMQDATLLAFGRNNAPRTSQMVVHLQLLSGCNPRKLDGFLQTLVK